MQLITLAAGSVPADRIPGILNENGIRVNPYAEKYFAHPRFSAVLAEETDVTVASLQEIGLENGAPLDEIFQRLPQIGLKPCSPGTALFLRLAWSDQPMSRNSVLSGTHEAPDRAVTVLSEILEEDDAFPKGLYLRNVDGVLWLRGYTCDAEYRFPADSLFAFETAGGETGVNDSPDVSDEDLAHAAEFRERILFIGNSFTYFNGMPATVQGMADAAGIEADVRMLAYGGYELRRYTDPEDPHGGEALPLIASEPWDAVVLQEQSIAPAVRRELFREGTDGLIPAIRERGARPVFYATWPYQDGSPKLEETGLGYHEMLRLLTEGYQAEADRLACPLVPVGEAFVRFQETYPDFSLYKSDFYHPNAAGSYLAACLFFRFFFGRDVPETYLPEGLAPADAETVRRFTAGPES